MKNLKFFSIYFLIALFSFSSSQNMEYESFSDIFILDSSFVWAITSRGDVWYSSNDGSSWEIGSTQINPALKVYFINPTDGWLLSEDKIYFSSNAGKNWSLNFEPESFHFRDISFLNDSLGFTLGFGPNGSKVYKTLSSGMSWTAVFDSSLVTSLSKIHILNEENVWMLRNNVIYKTTDLGETWETIFYSNVTVGFSFLTLSMFSETLGILGKNYDDIVQEGILLITTDGGYSWDFYPNPSFHFGITDLFFASLNTGWVADWNTNILYTSTQGNTWDSLQNYSTLPGPIIKFASMDEMKAWAITPSNILHTKDGWQTFSSQGSISDINEQSLQKPIILQLFQNYPNPFNPSTKIKFTVPLIETGHAQSVQLKVYDVLGNEVATLVNEEKPAGSYEVEFNGTALPSGIYFYQLKAGNPSTSSGQSFVETKKMILMK